MGEVQEKKADMKPKDRRKAKKRELKRKRVDEELSKNIPNTWSGGFPEVGRFCSL